MRTLFLIGILYFLVAIATKKPDQTAWDSARDLGTRAQHAVSEVQEQATNNPVVVETLRKTTKNLMAGSLDLPEQETYRAPRRDHNYGGSSDVSETEVSPTEIPPPGGDIFSPLESEQPSPGIFPDPEATFRKEEKPLPLPRLPATPVLPVQTVQPEAIPSARTPENDVRLAGSSDYGEVKALYENASRLLDEIE